MFDSDKTEKPTPRRRQQAREKGQVAKSQDLISAILLFVSFILLMSIGRNLAESIFDFSRSLFAQNDLTGLGFEPFSHDSLSKLPFWISKITLYFSGQLILFWIIIVLTGAGSHLIQTGWLFLPEKVTFDWKNLSPMRGLTRIFSFDGVFRVGIGFCKILICLLIVYWTFWGRRDSILSLCEYNSWQIVAILADFLYLIGLRLSVALFILAVLDFFYQRWKLENDLRMTPQEIREEIRETVGDPQVIAQRKQRRMKK